MSADDDNLRLDPLALAVQERFLEEWRTGRRPRLSVYARRYPAYAAALADLVATLPFDAQADDEVGAGGAPQPETTAESFPQRLWTGEGVGRALDDIFGSMPQPDIRRLPRVAEERSPYQTSEASEGVTPDTPDDQSRHD